MTNPPVSSRHQDVGNDSPRRRREGKKDFRVQPFHPNMSWVLPLGLTVPVSHSRQRRHMISSGNSGNEKGGERKLKIQIEGSERQLVLSLVSSPIISLSFISIS